jgi:hypothetical protein
MLPQINNRSGANTQKTYHDEVTQNYQMSRKTPPSTSNRVVYANTHDPVSNRHSPVRYTLDESPFVLPSLQRTESYNLENIRKHRRKSSNKITSELSIHLTNNHHQSVDNLLSELFPPNSNNHNNNHHYHHHSNNNNTISEPPLLRASSIATDQFLIKKADKKKLAHGNSKRATDEEATVLKQELSFLFAKQKGIDPPLSIIQQDQSVRLNKLISAL